VPTAALKVAMSLLRVALEYPPAAVPGAAPPTQFAPVWKSASVGVALHTWLAAWAEFVPQRAAQASREARERALDGACFMGLAILGFLPKREIADRSAFTRMLIGDPCRGVDYPKGGIGGDGRLEDPTPQGLRGAGARLKA
jgi:hypothetical protein